MGFRGRAALTVVAAWLVVACGEKRPASEPKAPQPVKEIRSCTGHIQPALVVRLVSAGRTGPQVCETTSVTVRDGAFQEPLRADSFTDEHGVVHCQFRGADERAGTYEITVRSAGGAVQKLTSIVVADDGCHPVTRTLEVRIP